MKLNDVITEAEKTRLDPKCWTGKKIGNPKTKVKGGVRVNNCVPAESVAEGTDPNTQSHADAFKSETDTMKPGTKKYVGRKGGKEVTARKDEQGNVKFYHRDGIKGPLKRVNEMDSQGYKGSRDDYELGKGKEHTGRPVTAKKATTDAERIMNRAHNKMMNSMSSADKVKKGWRNPNMKEGATTTWEVSYDYGPHMTETVTVKASSEDEARAKVEKAAEKKGLDIMINSVEPAEQGVAEGSNAEYDDEAGMADNNLDTLRRAVDGLDDLIDTGDNLPEWCQEKIAVAKSMLVAVWDYMESEEDSEEVDPEVDEMFEAMEGLVQEIAQRDQLSEDLVWESFESLDDHMLYETAAWRRKEGKSKSGGLNAKGVASYRRENPGSKLQTAVTTKPSKLKKGSKAAKRRKSFCARMSGVKGPMKKPNGKPTRKALALRKWNC